MNPKVRVALSFLDANLHRDIYVAEVAELVRLSPSRLCRLFKIEVGVSVYQYIKKARLEKACRRLETSFDPIKQIAGEVGYNDPNHFEREFKKANGLTPLEYRARYHTSVTQSPTHDQKEKNKVF